MRIRHIVILAALVMLLSSCSIGGLTVQTAGPETPTRTFATNTDQTTSVPAISEPTPEPPPVVKTSEPEKIYCIIVDKEDKAFGIFECGEDGEPNTLVETFPCALGKSGRMTPTGTYKTGDKQRWKEWADNIYGKYSPYATYYTYVNEGYTGGLYIHGPTFTEKDPSKLYKKSYEQIGTNCTSGCIRTTTEGAYWVYTYCQKGTVIKIVNNSDLVSWPGLPEIDPDYPTWDPTDSGLPH